MGGRNQLLGLGAFLNCGLSGPPPHFLFLCSRALGSLPSLLLGPRAGPRGCESEQSPSGPDAAHGPSRGRWCRSCQQSSAISNRESFLRRADSSMGRRRLSSPVGPVPLGGPGSSPAPHDVLEGLAAPRARQQACTPGTGPHFRTRCSVQATGAGLSELLLSRNPDCCIPTHSWCFSVRCQIPWGIRKPGTAVVSGRWSLHQHRAVRGRVCVPGPVPVQARPPSGLSEAASGSFQLQGGCQLWEPRCPPNQCVCSLS